MIFIDSQGHMVSDTSLEELHRFARRLRLKEEWFQNHPIHPHYDLTTDRKRQQAFKFGAKLASSREISKFSRQMRRSV